MMTNRRKRTWGAGILSLVAELKRRNVFRAAAAYVAVAWLVIQVAETTFPAFSLSDAALRTLIILLAVGFVPAIALSWAFELTPEGFRRDRDVAPGSELDLRTKRMLDRGIVAVLALGLAYFAFDKFVLDPARDEAKIEEAEQRGRTEALVESYGDQSIAVLPFTNMSADPEQEYFGDGMAEEVLNLLARIPELRVISRSSAFTYKGKDKKLTEIAEELNVVHILEGSVRRAGNKIRVTAQLIEARSDTHLWSQTWDRELENIFTIQDEIAEEVVANLKLKLLGEMPKARRVDPEAYLLFMQARQVLDGWDHSQYERVDALLREAIRIDPDFAEPWTGIAWLSARCYVLGPDRGIPYCDGRTPEELQATNDAAIDRALEIDPANPTAIAYKAWGLAYDERKFRLAAQEFSRAIRLAPPVTDVLRSASLFARHVLRPDIAVRLLEYAMARDPLCQQCFGILELAYLEAGQPDKAEQMAALRIAAGQGGWVFTAWARLLAGRPGAALEALDAHGERPDEAGDLLYLQARAMALHALGRVEESRAALEALELEASQKDPQSLAEVYAWMGDLETGSAWLERTLDGPVLPFRFLPFEHWSPLLRPVLALPRWQAVLREQGLADDQLAQIEFEFTLPGE